MEAASPLVSSFSFSPTTVDTSSGDATVTLTAHVTDNVGVTEGSGYRLYRPNSAYETWIRGNFVLESGTAQDGNWTATVPISMDAGTGEWRIEFNYPRY